MPDYKYGSNFKEYINSDEYKKLVNNVINRTLGYNTEPVNVTFDGLLKKYGVNPNTGQDIQKVNDLDYYKQQAINQYDPIYNNKVTNLKNQLAQNIASLQNSKIGINRNYDNQINKNNNYIKGTQNQISNMTLGRGLGRSTIATSGIAEQANIGARMNNETNYARAQDLSAVDNQIATLEQNTNNILTTMANDREKEIMDLARQLMEKDESTRWQQILHQDEMWENDKDREFKTRESQANRDFQKEMQLETQNFENQQRIETQKFQMQLAATEQQYKKELAQMGYNENARERLWKEKQAQLEREHQLKMQKNEQAFQAQQLAKQLAAQKAIAASNATSYRPSYSSYRPSYSSSTNEVNSLMSQINTAKQALLKQKQAQQAAKKKSTATRSVKPNSTPKNSSDSFINKITKSISNSISKSVENPNSWTNKLNRWIKNHL